MVHSLGYMLSDFTEIVLIEDALYSFGMMPEYNAFNVVSH